MKNEGNMDAEQDEPSSGWCGTTDWSALIMAGNPNSPAAQQALEELCRRYWPPIHAYIRRRLNNDGNAKDLTQDFFAHLLENNGLAGIDKSKGRFRSFLLVSVKNFLANERERGIVARSQGDADPLGVVVAGGADDLELHPDFLAPQHDRLRGARELDAVLGIQLHGAAAQLVEEARDDDAGPVLLDGVPAHARSAA